MFGFDTFSDHGTFWILAINTLLHELGLPVPLVPLALFAGARAESGSLDLLILVLAILAGTVIGNSVWFAAGRLRGVGALGFLCRMSLSSDTCVARTQRAWIRWGGMLLIIGRFLPVVSLLAPPLAGALGMSWNRFLVLTSAGTALYALALVGTGMLLRTQIELVIRAVDGQSWHALIAFLAVISIYIVWRGWWHRRATRRSALLVSEQDRSN